MSWWLNPNCIFRVKITANRKPPTANRELKEGGVSPKTRAGLKFFLFVPRDNEITKWNGGLGFTGGKKQDPPAGQGSPTAAASRGGAQGAALTSLRRILLSSDFAEEKSGDSLWARGRH